jgi:hypothetical protein
MRPRTLFFGALGLASLLGLYGCGGAAKPVKVKGTVTLDGKPLPNGLVKFIPTAERGREATGLTEADGSFQLETFTTADGALPGDYKVTVQYQEPVSQSDIVAPQPGKSMKGMWDATQKAQREQQKKAPKYVVPAKYGDRKETTLQQRVPPEGPVLFELRSK